MILNSFAYLNFNDEGDNMGNYLKRMIKELSYDNGEKFNNLINNNLIKLDDVVSDVIRFGTSQEIFNVAKYVKGVSIKMLESAIIERGSSHFIYLFAKEIRGACIPFLAYAIMETNNANYIFWFAVDIDNAPYEMMINKLIDMGEIELADSVIKSRTSSKMNKKTRNLTFK